jgi:hypothetical protein
MRLQKAADRRFRFCRWSLGDRLARKKPQKPLPFQLLEMSRGGALSNIAAARPLLPSSSPIKPFSKGGGVPDPRAIRRGDGSRSALLSRYTRGIFAEFAALAPVFVFNHARVPPLT